MNGAAVWCKMVGVYSLPDENNNYVHVNVNVLKNTQ